MRSRDRGRGWYREPVRHSLSSKGVPTTAKGEYKTVGEETYLSQIERDLGDYDRRTLVSVAKEGLDSDFAAKEYLVHGYCGLYANFLHYLLGFPVYKITHNDEIQHWVVKTDGQFYDAFGKVTDEHLENALLIPKGEGKFEEIEGPAPTPPVIDGEDKRRLRRIIKRFTDRVEEKS